MPFGRICASAGNTAINDRDVLGEVKQWVIQQNGGEVPGRASLQAATSKPKDSSHPSIKDRDDDNDDDDDD